MVQMHEVGDFVRNDGLAHPGRGHDKPPAIGDASAARAASPASLGIAEADARHRLSGLFRIGPAFLAQHLQRPPPQPSFHPAVQPLRRSADDQPPVWCIMDRDTRAMRFPYDLQYLSLEDRKSTRLNSRPY